MMAGTPPTRAAAGGPRVGEVVAAVAVTVEAGEECVRSGWHSGLDLDDFDGSDEAEERMNNFGFTEDEVMELLCQGVKPWDDDAWVSTFGFEIFCVYLILVLGCPRRTLLALTTKPIRIRLHALSTVQ
jgi:hypothetical protein